MKIIIQFNQYKQIIKKSYKQLNKKNFINKIKIKLNKQNKI